MIPTKAAPAVTAERPNPRSWVTTTRPSFFGSGPQVEASRSQAFNNVRTDVLVDEEGKVERLHAVILNSQVCSPLSASAAY